MLSAYVETYPKDLLKKITTRTGDYVVTIIMSLFLSSCLVLFGLYVFSVITAGVIAIFFIFINFISPVAVTILILFC